MSRVTNQIQESARMAVGVEIEGLVDPARASPRRGGRRDAVAGRVQRQRERVARVRSAGTVRPKRPAELVDLPDARPEDAADGRGREDVRIAVRVDEQGADVAFGAVLK